MDVGPLLVERETTHGNFSDVARVAQAIKDALRSGPSAHMLTPCMRESLESTATKMARIVCGDPLHRDHWRDPQGYARLVEERLP